MEVKSFVPKNYDELGKVLSLLPENNLVFGGGTDLVMRIRERHLTPEAVLYVGDVKETGQIEEKDGYLCIGSSVTMREAWNDPLVNKWFKALVHGVQDIGSMQIRNRATLAGNVASASPAGDMLPILYLYDAIIETMGPDGETKRTPVDEFIAGKGKTRLSYNEVITAILLPIPETAGYHSAFYKLGSRMKVTISRIGMAVAFRLDDEERVVESRIYLGATFPKPRRIEKAEEIARGRKIDKTLTDEIGAILFNIIYEVTPRGFERHDAQYYERYYRYYKPYSVLGVVEDVFARAMETQERA